MTVVRYEPWSLFDRLARQTLDHTLSFIPAVDVLEEKDRYVVRADLPGVSKDAIEITTADGVLTIKGERKTESTQAEAGYSRFERHSGSFVRHFSLPETAQVEAIKASHVNGVLEVVIPKQTQPAARRIRIEAA